MKAILLAAGRGSRLGSHTDAMPKSLLDLGGTPLIVRSLHALRAAGVQKAVVVTDYLHEMLAEAIRRSFDEAFCRIIVNPDYTHGTASSLRCAADELAGDLLLLEADLLYDEEVPRRMLAAGDALALGRFGHNRIEGKIVLRNGLIASIAWGGADVQADGDWVGLTRLSPPVAEAIRRMLDEPFDPSYPALQSYTTYVFALVERFPFRAVNLDDLPWIEIDNEEDLLAARRDVLPRLGSISGGKEIDT
ncbi:phosphocholine cytidylyltransferase family protein [Salinarimonas ramus]|uniref:Nucleotidyltransferase n=1 Tax=Salinarimonas ramus TaxID=690164 RepID=A0A917QBX4_9HYPH|nr:NTP transferase domain-containing protein [Salinarimonas ramus]GGK42856.1 nucleotidyltransferase [Salinarimonas ramus]